VILLADLDTASSSRRSPVGKAVFRKNRKAAYRPATAGVKAKSLVPPEDPYGRTTLVSGSNLSDFQYAGYYTHQPSGLNLTLFRAYDSSTARWLSRDPIAENGGINLYGYVANNPIWAIDPFGLETYFTHYTGLDDGYRVDGIYASAAVGVAAITVATAGSADAIAAAIASRFPWLVPAAIAAKKAADGLNGQEGASCPAAAGKLGQLVSPNVKKFMNGDIPFDKLSPQEIQDAIKGYQDGVNMAKDPITAAFQQARINALNGQGPLPGTFNQFKQTYKP
jgi:RHS repeat-associated protein